MALVYITGRFQAPSTFGATSANVTFTLSGVFTTASLAGTRTLTDGVMSSVTTPAILTSATAAFTSADQGKFVTVTGAGAAGVTLGGSIITVNSATSATLNVNALSTVSGATVNVLGGQSHLVSTGPPASAVDLVAGGFTTMVESTTDGTPATRTYLVQLNMVIGGVTTSQTIVAALAVAPQPNFTTLDELMGGGTAQIIPLSATTPAIALQGTAPYMTLRDTQQTLPLGLWRIRSNSDTFILEKNTATAGDFSALTAVATWTATGLTGGSLADSVLAITATANDAVRTGPGNNAAAASAARITGAADTLLLGSPLFYLTGAAQTGIQTGSELNYVNFNLAQTRTWATGNFGTQREVLIQAPTYAFVAASTVTDAATFDITGAPIAGANATFTRAHALRVEGGLTSLGGPVVLGAASTTPIAGGGVTITTAARATGSPSLLSVIGPADVTLTASTEAIGINLNMSTARQFATGALTTQREVLVQAPTYQFVAASTLTDAATFDISGAPIAGTNATITRSHALRVESGQSSFGGAVLVGTTAAVATGGSGITVQPAARTTGSPSLLTITAPADTTLTASTESIGANFNMSATRQFATGALTTQREVLIQAPTYGFVAASTITDAATLDVTGAPIAGTNATLTRAHALRVEGGQTSLGGGVLIGATNAVATAGSGLTIGPAARTTGSPALLTVTAPADTTLTASTESNSVNFNLSATRQFATGALTTQREVYVQAPTYGFVAASTVTDAATFDVSGAPIAGTNATLTRSHALRVEGGQSTLGGGVVLGANNLALAAGQTFLQQPAARTTGSPTMFSLVGPADTTLTASVESTNVLLNLSATRQFATGALTQQREIRIQAPTYGFVAASTVTGTATLAIDGPPVAGTNATLSDTSPLWVNANAGLVAGGQAMLTAGASAGVMQGGLYIGTGAPTIAAMNGSSYIRIDGTVSGNTAFYINSSGASTRGTTWTAIETVSTGGTAQFTALGINVAPGPVGTVLIQGAAQSSGTAALEAITSGINTGGAIPYFTVTGAASTGQTASTEINFVNFNLAQTVTWATGAITTERAVLVQAPTLAFAAASTVTDAATFDITGAPVAGTNATITRSHALRVEGGQTSLGAGVLIGATNAVATAGSGLTIGPAARTTGSPSLLTVTSPADTTLTASTESIGVNLNMSATRQFATGAITTQREVLVQAPTYAFVAASTITDAATFDISGAPIAGTNATLTRFHAFRVESGQSSFGAGVIIGTTSAVATAGSGLTIAPAARTTGSPSLLTVTGPADTTLTASVESNGVLLNLSATRQFATGALTTQREVYVQAPTYGFVAASTITDATTFDISGAPVAGTNATLTRAHAFRVEAGQSTLGGGVVIGANNVALGTGQTFLLQPAARTTGSPNMFSVVGPADTTLTASVESTNVLLNLSATRQFATGALTTQREVYIQAPTYGFVAASTVTDAATFDISGAPIAGTNATLTRSHALRVEGGQASFGGAVLVGTTAAVATVGSGLTIAPAARTTGSPSLFTITGPADTTLTASAEAIGANFNMSATRQFATGALTTQREVLIQAPTYGFVAASTITDAATLDITGAPIAGTNATITRAHALRVEGGQTSLGAGVLIGATNAVATAGSGLTIAPAARTTGSPSLLTVTAPADTTLTAGAESSGVVLNMGATRQFATGAITTQREIRLVAPTYSFVAASTITNAATLSINNAPVAGANATLTNAYSLWIQQGPMLISDNFQVNTGMTTLVGTAQSSGTTAVCAISASVNTGGSSPYLTVTGAASTTQAASTEINFVNLNLAQTVQWATGALTTERACYVQAPTLAFVAASTVTDAATFDISGAPIAGANATLTRAHALRVEGGQSSLGGALVVGNASLAAAAGNALTVQPAVRTTGSPVTLLLTQPADTTLTASTESIGANFNMSATRQFATGALTTQREVLVQAPTYGFVAASTITDAATFDINGAPVAGANATLTRAHALRVEGGQTSLGGALVVGSASLAAAAGSSVTIQPAARTTGSPVTFLVTQPADTTLTASTESIGANFNMSATRQFATGALTNQREVYFQAPTYGFVGASTITNTATVAISAAPIAGTFATLTNSVPLWIDFAKTTPAAGSVTQGILFGSAPALGIYYGSGAPTLSAPQGSLYLRTDGSSTSTRAYIATSSAGAWTAITTAA